MSAPSSGVFDCSDVQEVKRLADVIFTDDVRKADYLPESDTAQLLIGSQTARLEVLENPEKDFDLKAYWVIDCDDDDAVDATRACDIDGNPIGDMCANYRLTKFKSKGFSISENQFRVSTLSKEQVVAPMLLKKLLLMDRTISKAAIAFLNANSGVNVYPGPYSYAGGVTSVSAAAMGSGDFFGYLAKVRAINKLPQMKVLDSGTLFQPFWKATMEASNPTGAAELRKMGSFGQPTFDLFQIENVVGDPAMFLINPNSVAFASKARYKNNGTGGKPEIMNGKQSNLSIVKSPTLPGVWYDLVYQRECITGRDFNDVWNIESQFDWLLNPLGCNNGRTGILQLQCAA